MISTYFMKNAGGKREKDPGIHGSLSDQSEAIYFSPSYPCACLPGREL